MPGNPSIKPEGKNYFLSSLRHHDGCTTLNSKLDRKSRTGYNSMAGFPGIAHERNNPFLSTSSHNSSVHDENTKLDRKDKDGYNSMPAFAGIAQERNNCLNFNAWKSTHCSGKKKLFPIEFKIS